MSAGLAGLRAVVVNWRDLEHPLAGGSEHYAWHAARALRDGGAEVEFLTARAEGQTRHAVVDGIRVHRAGSVLGFYPVTLLRLLRRRRRVDLVVDASSGIPVFSPLVLRRSTPVVLVMHHVHQDQFGTYFPRPMAALGRFLERASARVYRHRRVVAVSESTRAEMRRRLAWHGPVGILANGADRPVVDVVAEEKQRGRVAVLGRLVTHKRVDAVLEAFAGLLADPHGLDAATASALHLDVVGTGPEAERLAAHVVRLGLAERVTLHGFVDEPTKSTLLRRAALHVCASDAEGWGQVVIEAAAHGAPTLARDVPGLRSSIRDGVTGWLLPETDETLVVRLREGMRSALADLDDVETAALLVKRTQDHAADHSWSAMHERVRALANHIARPGGPDAALER